MDTQVDLVVTSQVLPLKSDFIHNKEVIQPQVPLRLPCYDFTPVMNHTVVSGLITYSLLVQPTPMV